MSETKEPVETIDINYLSKVDIRTAKIVDAQPHPNADKLVVLQVDVGEENPKQIVAGIKAYYPIEALESMKGSTIIIVNNLNPVKLRGVESNGMVLAAKFDEKLSLITTCLPDVPSGTKLS